MTLVRYHCAQVPDIKTETNSVHAVLVDEEAVGSVDAPGRGAKILSGDGVLEQFLHETKSGDHMVCFSEAPHSQETYHVLLCLSIFFILLLLD